MNKVCGFPPVVSGKGEVLILGSMPGEASLFAGQYYAHPRNLFWPIMGELVCACPSLPYEQRLEALMAAGISLWDVLESCVRPGSLDSAIRCERANDFASFFAANSRINKVYFNGAKAEHVFLKHAAPALKIKEKLVLKRLPSTSPAHAGLTFEQKLEEWRKVIDRS